MGRTAFAALVTAGVILSFSSGALFADERCRQLEDLNRQYAGVDLTSQQKKIKRQMIAWYKANCA